jgi:hypothetical protein
MRIFFILLSIIFTFILQVEFMTYGTLVSPAELRPMVLTGSNAFYNQPDYEATTEKELAVRHTLPPSEIYELESKAHRVATDVFSTIFFPWGLYRCLHTAYGNVFFNPSQSSSIASEARPQIKLNSEWKYRPIYPIG